MAMFLLQKFWSFLNFLFSHQDIELSGEDLQASLLAAAATGEFSPSHQQEASQDAGSGDQEVPQEENVSQGCY